ncbi:MAG TPA: SGNH/GDSL hydrolase family protein [Armatimonadota bacterium]|jgi:acyl-CoA thioesterase-1
MMRLNYRIFVLCCSLALLLLASAGFTETLTPISYAYDGVGKGATPANFPDTGGKELTDGAMPATTAFADAAWVGFLADTRDLNDAHPQVTFDFGKRVTPTQLTIVYLHSTTQASGSITAPEEMRVSVSDDGKSFAAPVTYTTFSSEPGDEIRTATFDLNSAKLSGQYFRLDFRNASQWTFLTEVSFATGATTGAKPAAVQPEYKPTATPPATTPAATAGQLVPVGYAYDGTGPGATPTTFLDAGGTELLDGKLPLSTAFPDGAWVGFRDTTKDATQPHPQVTFDFGKRVTPTQVKIVYLHSSTQAGGSITAPDEVRIATSDDGKTFSAPVTCTNFSADEGDEIRTAVIDLNDAKLGGQYYRLDFRNTSEWTFLTEVSFFTGTKPGTTVAAPAATTGPRRIAFLGDSITAGVGVSDPLHRYSTLVTKALTTADAKVEEINMGISGQALCGQGANYAADVLQRQPDAVVIAWGVNDEYWGYSVTQFAAAYEQLIIALRQAKPALPIVATTLVADYRFADCERWLGPANVAIQEIAARYGCQLADIHRTIDHQRATYYKDTIHPNDAGAQVMADTIVKAFAVPALSKTNMRFTFDQGDEVRFMRYVFHVTRTDDNPHWTEIQRLDQEGMVISSELPLSVRTAPLYNAKKYRIEMTDAKGTLISSTEVTPAYGGILNFTITPSTPVQAVTVSIQAL